MNVKQQWVKLLTRWRSSLEYFVEEALGVNPKNNLFISKQQRDACQKVSKLVNAKRKVLLKKPLTAEDKEYVEKIGISIMSGQGTGKDAFCSWVMCWWLCCFTETLIPCTAPTADQIRNILWSEFVRWYNRLDADMNPMCVFKGKDEPSSHLVVESQKIYVRQFAGKECFAFWKTANPKDDPESQAGTLYGFHAPYMMIVIDEASSVPEPVFKPLEGTITSAQGVNWILMLFNPIYQAGYAVNSHMGIHAKNWVQIHWDAEDSELVSKQHIVDMEEKYGRNSNTFRTLVKGLPPLAEADTLIPYDWVMKAVNRPIDVLPDEPRIGGLDVGAGGDNSELCIRQGNKVFPFHRHNSPDTMELVGWASKLFDEEGLQALFIDVIGVGNGVYNRLRELGYRVYPVDVRMTARKEEFHNIRDELWWKLRDVFESQTISIPPDEELKAELWNPKYKIDSTKKTKIESKYDMKRRLGFAHSPNKADSLALTLYMNDSVFRRVAEKDPYFMPDRQPDYGGRAWMAM